MSRMGLRPSPTGNSRRRFSAMANAKRASMREGPLAALFRKTQAAEEESAESPPPRQSGGSKPPPKPAATPPPEHPRESGLPHPGLSASTETPEETARVPTPRERLGHAFASEIPENMMDRQAARP